MVYKTRNQYNPSRGEKQKVVQDHYKEEGGKKGKKWEYNPSELEPWPNMPHGRRKI
jgi:hypothetical protein